MDDVAADNAEDLSRQAMESRDLHKNVEERGHGSLEVVLGKVGMLGTQCGGALSAGDGQGSAQNVEERGLGNADLAAWQTHILIEKRLLGVILDHLNHLGLFE